MIDNNTTNTVKPIDIDALLVRNAAGTIDVQQTHHRFTQLLSSRVAMERSDNEVISKAVQKAFSDAGLKKLSMSQLLQYTMNNLEVKLEDFQGTRDRIAAYIRSNNREFKVSKGKGGGVQWLLDEGSTGSIAPSSVGSVHPKSASVHPVRATA